MSDKKYRIFELVRSENLGATVPQPKNKINNNNTDKHLRTISISSHTNPYPRHTKFFSTRHTALYFSTTHKKYIFSGALRRILLKT